MINSSNVLKKIIILPIFIFFCASVKAGVNNFTDLIFVEDWLIERKIDLTNNEINCRASIPSHASWFGARVRLGSNNELIKPIWISVKPDQLHHSKLSKVKDALENCKSGFIFLPN